MIDGIDLLDMLNSKKTIFSRKELLIFFSEKDKRRYKKYYGIAADLGRRSILATLPHIQQTNFLDGIRFRKYRFVDVEECGKDKDSRKQRIYGSDI